MRTESGAVLKLTFTRRGNHRPVRTRLEFETAAPKPNHEHGLSESVRPLFVVVGDVAYWPTFQRFKGANTLYRNIATCILCFRNSNPQVPDFDIIMWFVTPNESLDWKTPLEVGRHHDKETRNKIIEIAEGDAPLGYVR